MGKATMWISISIFSVAAVFEIAIVCISLVSEFVYWNTNSYDTYNILYSVLYILYYLAIGAGCAFLCLSFKRGITEAQAAEAESRAKGRTMFQSGDWLYCLTPAQTAVITQYTGAGADVIIPDHLSGFMVTHIDSHAFTNARHLISITFPHTPIDLGINPFYSCTNLSMIRVPEDHPTLAINGGVLFSKITRKLIWYPATRIDTMYTIPDGIGTIDSHAFFGCTNLAEVTIPPCVTAIGEGAFARCPNLTLVVTAGTVAHRYAQENGLRFSTIYPENTGSMGWLGQA